MEQISIDKVKHTQNFFPQDAQYGAIRCDLHGYHMQASLAILPIALQAVEGEEQKNFDAAVSLINWICSRQEPKGFWPYENEVLINNSLTLLAMTVAYVLMYPELRQLDKAGMEETLSRSIQWNMRIFKSTKLTKFEQMFFLTSQTLIQDKALLPQQFHINMNPSLTHSDIQKCYDFVPPGIALWEYMYSLMSSFFLKEKVADACILAPVRGLFLKSFQTYAAEVLKTY
jgi:hypothetical protein